MRERVFCFILYWQNGDIIVHLCGPVRTAGVFVFSIEALTSSVGHVIDRDRGLSSSVVSLFTCKQLLLIPDGTF